MKLVARAIVVAEIIAIACWAVAIALYPGGSQAHPSAAGHSIWLNYLCDLADGTARNGEPNPGALFGRLGMAAMIAALALIFAGAPRLFRDRPRATLVTRAAGALCVIATAGVPLSAVLSSPLLHEGSVLIAGPRGLAACVAVVLGARSHRDLASVGAVMLASALVTLAVYAHHVVAGTSSTLLPVAQRASLITLLVWTALVAIRVHSVDRVSQ